MFVETIDLVAEWLGNQTFGVNALIPGVPLKQGDTQPPPVKSISATMRVGEIARSSLPQDPSKYPLILVGQHGDATMEVDIRQGAWDFVPIPIGIGYAIRDAASDEAQRHAAYTMVAILRSLWNMEDPGNQVAVAARQRNNVTIQAIMSLAALEPSAELKDIALVRGYVVGFRVRHNKPGG